MLGKLLFIGFCFWLFWFGLVLANGWLGGHSLTSSEWFGIWGMLFFCEVCAVVVWLEERRWE